MTRQAHCSEARTLPRVLTYQPDNGIPSGSAPAAAGTATTVEALLRAHLDQRADVIVVHAPAAAPTWPVQQVLARDATASVFVAGGPTDAAALAEAIKGGARGFLCRSRQDPPAQATRTDVTRAAVSPRLLTRREHEVLTAMSHGRTNAEIASTLQVSQATVKVYAQHLFLKLRTRDRAQAVATAFRDGLLT